MVEIRVAYEGDLRCVATHVPSGVMLTTDAPVDNEGRGASFSPTDLVATALGSCMLTIMGIVARRRGIDLGAADAFVQKEMAAPGRRRIARLSVRIDVPKPVGPEDRAALEAAAQTCPVAESLHPDIAVDVSFRWAPEGNAASSAPE